MFPPKKTSKPISVYKIWYLFDVGYLRSFEASCKQNLHFLRALHYGSIVSVELSMPIFCLCGTITRATSPTVLIKMCSHVLGRTAAYVKKCYKAFCCSGEAACSLINHVQWCHTAAQLHRGYFALTVLDSIWKVFVKVFILLHYSSIHANPLPAPSSWGWHWLWTVTKNNK